MNFENIVGNAPIISYLKNNIEHDRIAHAQLFIGQEGFGTLPMAIAYATEIICYKKDADSRKRCQQLTHPDLHFVFPVNKTQKVDKDPVSDLFYEEWKTFLYENPYADLYQWYKHIGIDSKQGNISVKEARDIASKLSLKSYEGGYKVMIIWHAEKMNTEASNHLLKLLEEPPQKTVFILVVENEEQLLDTVRSRCQITRLIKPSIQSIELFLQKKGIPEQRAKEIAARSNGNINRALSLIDNSSSDEIKFEQWFVFWVRTAFRAKGNKTVIHDLVQWSDDISSQGKEIQKQFLLYCMETFRQAMLVNYQLDQLTYLNMENTKFNIHKFAPFVHSDNITPIFKAIEKAITHIERNVNSKMIFTDLSIQLTRFLHTPQP